MAGLTAALSSNQIMIQRPLLHGSGRFRLLDEEGAERLNGKVDEPFPPGYRFAAIKESRMGQVSPSTILSCINEFMLF